MALAAPQRVLGATASSGGGDAVAEPTWAPADPVIEEPIRPLFPNGTDRVARARDCGTPGVFMMSASAWFVLMLNFASDRGRMRHTT